MKNTNYNQCELYMYNEVLGQSCLKLTFSTEIFIVLSEE